MGKLLIVVQLQWRHLKAAEEWQKAGAVTTDEHYRVYYDHPSSTWRVDELGGAGYVSKEDAMIAARDYENERVWALLTPQAKDALLRELEGGP